MLAQNTLRAGERLLVVSGDDQQLARIDEALWTARADGFLAHGFAGGPHEARQPVLLSDEPTAGNEAKYVAFADGRWRDEAERFERVFLLFDAASIDAARGIWRQLDAREDVERNYWEQAGGKWERKA